MNSRNPIAVAVAALVASGSLGGCTAQIAKWKRAEAAAIGATEPCFGVARAGKNDCKTSKHICAGYARQARDPAAFLFVPEGTCEKLVGGRLEES